jgi:hypothetical protein
MVIFVCKRFIGNEFSDDTFGKMSLVLYMDSRLASIKTSFPLGVSRADVASSFATNPDRTHC